MKEEMEEQERARRQWLDHAPDGARAEASAGPRARDAPPGPATWGATARDGFEAKASLWPSPSPSYGEANWQGALEVRNGQSRPWSPHEAQLSRPPPRSLMPARRSDYSPPRSREQDRSAAEAAELHVRHLGEPSFASMRDYNTSGTALPWEGLAAELKRGGSSTAADRYTTRHLY